MSDKTEKPDIEEDSFVQRWSRRKHEQQRKSAAPPAPQEDEYSQHAPVSEPVMTEADLPSIDSLNPDSEVGMFFSEGINEKIRRQALRKLFHFQKFNVVDGLDDYAEDYTIFQPLYHLYSSREDIQKLARKVTEHNEENPEQNTHTAYEADIPEAENSVVTRNEYDDEDLTRKE